MSGDRCPYRRPFPPAFDACPAYTPAAYTAIDLRYRPTTPINTCARLCVGDEPGQPGSFYPRCSLGTAEQRLAWIGQISAQRMEGLRRLSDEYRDWSRGRMGPLWELKGKLLAARHRRDLAQARALSRELEIGAEQLTHEAEAFVDDHADECATVGLPMEPLKEFIRLSVTDWAWSSTLSGGYQIPDRLLARFPEAVRLFFTSSRSPASTPV